MADCAITATLRDATGTVVPNATIIFTPIRPDNLRSQDGSVIICNPVTAVASVGGVLTVTLKTGTYTYATQGRMGLISGEVTVRDTLTANLAVLLANPPGTYELIGWPAYRDLVGMTPTPFASVTLGLAATGEGNLFMAASDGNLTLYRRVSGAPVLVYLTV